LSVYFALGTVPGNEAVSKRQTVLPSPPAGTGKLKGSSIAKPARSWDWTTLSHVRLGSRREHTVRVCLCYQLDGCRGD
jgi:hypothetical protein